MGNFVIQIWGFFSGRFWNSPLFSLAQIDLEHAVDFEFNCKVVGKCKQITSSRGVAAVTCQKWKFDTSKGTGVVCVCIYHVFHAAAASAAQQQQQQQQQQQREKHRRKRQIVAGSKRSNGALCLPPSLLFFQHFISYFSHFTQVNCIDNSRPKFLQSFQVHLKRSFLN